MHIARNRTQKTRESRASRYFVRFPKRFCRKYHIKKLSIFGSYLREDFGPESDRDLLVEFDQEQTPGLLMLPEWKLNCPRCWAEKLI
jgi:predicted nucleotidyltransferase